MKGQYKRLLKEEKVSGLKKTRLVSQDEDVIFVKMEIDKRTLERTFQNNVLGRESADQFYKSFNSKADLESHFKKVESKVKR